MMSMNMLSYEAGRLSELCIGTEKRQDVQSGIDAVCTVAMHSLRVRA